MPVLCRNTVLEAKEGAGEMEVCNGTGPSVSHLYFRMLCFRLALV